MRKIELLFTYTPNNFVSWAIKTKLGTPYSHVAIKFYSNVFGCNMIYEANWKGVNLSNEENWLKHNSVIVHTKAIELTDSEFKERITKMGKYLGANYGSLSILEILFGNVNLGANKGLICSEVAYLWLEGLIEIDKPREWITPKDIAEALGIK